MDTQNVQKVEVVSTISGATKLCGVLALIAAILAFIIPIIGPLFLTLFALFFGILALRGGARGMGIATTILIVVNLIISPTFWANLFAAAKSGPNAVIAGLDIIGVLLLFYFIAKRK